MRDIQEIRLDNLRFLRAKKGSNAIYRAMGWNSSTLSQYAGKGAKRKITENVARRLEKGFNLEPLWMDKDRSKEPAEAPESSLRALIVAVEDCVDSLNIKLSSNAKAEIIEALLPLASGKDVDAGSVLKIIRLVYGKPSE